MRTQNKHIFTKILILFTTVALLTGCHKNNAIAQTTNGVPQDTDQSSPQDTNSILAAEALKAAVQCAADHWIIQEDGALWTGTAASDLYQCAYQSDMQFKPITPDLVPGVKTEADQLNGVEWSGAVHFLAPAYRFQLWGTNTWGDWQKWPFGTFWSVGLEKRNGKWTATEQRIVVDHASAGTSDDGRDVYMDFYSVKSIKPKSQ